MSGGYDGYSRSKRAVVAELDGKVVASKITNAWLAEAGIDESAAYVRWLIRNGIVIADEWHHTSSHYNRTDYYSADSVREGLETVEATWGRDAAHQVYRDRKQYADDYAVRAALTAAKGA